METMLLDLEGDSLLYLHGLAVTVLVTLLLLLGLGSSGEAPPRPSRDAGEEEFGTRPKPLG